MPSSNRRTGRIPRPCPRPAPGECNLSQVAPSRRKTAIIPARDRLRGRASRAGGIEYARKAAYPRGSRKSTAADPFFVQPLDQPTRLGAFPGAVNPFDRYKNHGPFPTVTKIANRFHAPSNDRKTGANRIVRCCLDKYFSSLPPLAPAFRSRRKRTLCKLDSTLL